MIYQDMKNVIKPCSWYDTKELEAFNVEKKFVIKNSFNNFIPRYTNDDSRRKELPAVTLYKSGEIKSIDLQNVTEVKIGNYIFKAEKVLFYKSGSIKKIFPLNGKLSAFWTEDDEYKLANKYKFDFPFTKIDNKIISVKFYENGLIKSITVWPKEKFGVLYKNRIIECRTGISLYESGKIKSLEPRIPFVVHTPIGCIEAFDYNSIGIHGENNSLKFNEDGSVKELVTSKSKIIVTKKNGTTAIYSPRRERLFTGDTESLITTKIKFVNNKVIINGNNVYDLNNNQFNICS